MKVSVCCPVCRAWFYKTKGSNRKYCSPAHARIAASIRDNLARKARRRPQEPS